MKYQAELAASQGVTGSILEYTISPKPTTKNLRLLKLPSSVIARYRFIASGAREL